MAIFQQITIEQLIHGLTVASFMLFLCTIALLVVHAMGMPSKKVSHLETLPLDNESNDHE